MSKGITKGFERAARQQELTKVRHMLIKYIKMDPTGAAYDRAFTYAKIHIKEPYDIHDGEVFSEDQSLWTEAYYNQLVHSLEKNFSKERVQALLAVGALVKRDKIEQHEKRGEKRKAQQVEQANRSVGRIFIIVGASILGYGLVCTSIGNIMLGSAALTSGIVIIYMKRLKAWFGMK